MPSLYSWSCKRSYKNGHVWNDLSENDFICPDEGSAIIEGSTGNFTEKFQQIHIAESPQLMRNRQQVEESSSFLPKRKSLGSKRHPDEPEIVQNNHNYLHENEEELYEEKSSYSDDHNELTRKNNPTELTHTNWSSPPSTTPSSLSDKTINNKITNTSKRFEDGDPVVAESLLSCNSVLFQLICGGSASFRGKSTTTDPPHIMKQQQQTQPPPPCMLVARKSSSSCTSFHKGALCKASNNNLEMNEVEDKNFMSENPRFGNLQSSSKEYFSGSIVESMTTEERTPQVDPQLKKSSSYNEERSSKAGLKEEEEGKSRLLNTPKNDPFTKSSSWDFNWYLLYAYIPLLWRQNKGSDIQFRICY